MIAPVATALATVLATVDDLTVHTWQPAAISPPCAVIEPPTVRRRGLEEAESQLGSNDWLIDVPVTLYFDLRVAGPAQAGAVDYLDQVIQAIDANQGLGLDGVIEAKVTQAEPVFVLDTNRTLFSYECTVEVLREYVYQEA